MEELETFLMGFGWVSGFLSKGQCCVLCRFTRYSLIFAMGKVDTVALSASIRAGSQSESIV